MNALCKPLQGTDLLPDGADARQTDPYTRADDRQYTKDLQGSSLRSVYCRRSFCIVI